MRKPPGSLDAWAAYQRGLWHLSKATADDDATAEKFFEQAIVGFQSDSAAQFAGKKALADFLSDLAKEDKRPPK